MLCVQIPPFAESEEKAMKKIISVILVAALLLGFIAMTVSVASADAPINQINAVTEPVVGETPSMETFAVNTPNITVEWAADTRSIPTALRLVLPPSGKA